MPDKMFQHDFDQLARYENGRTPVLLTEEQYRRARACVNACAGISTDAIEQEGSAVMGWQRTARKLIDVTKQRDELMVALEGLHTVCAIALSGKDGKQHSYFETRAGHFVEATAAMERAEAAIASVKGSAS
jgi:hypothetical protein